MHYSIGEMAKMIGVPASTLRYYDKEGLLPFVERTAGGIRKFKAEDYEWLRIIECLKATGLEIKQIKAYIDMALAGDSTIKQRLQLFVEQREAVRQQIRQLQNTLEILDYKVWYYETAVQAGTAAVHKQLQEEEIPLRMRQIKQSMKYYADKQS